MTNREVPTAPYKIDQGDNCQPVINPIIAQLKKELVEAMDHEIMAQQLGHNTERWTGYMNGLHRAIQIVGKEKMK